MRVDGKEGSTPYKRKSPHPARFRLDGGFVFYTVCCDVPRHSCRGIHNTHNRLCVCVCVCVLCVVLCCVLYGGDNERYVAKSQVIL